MSKTQKILAPVIALIVLFDLIGFVWQAAGMALILEAIFSWRTRGILLSIYKGNLFSEHDQRTRRGLLIAALLIVPTVLLFAGLFSFPVSAVFTGLAVGLAGLIYNFWEGLLDDLDQQDREAARSRPFRFHVVAVSTDPDEKHGQQRTKKVFDDLRPFTVLTPEQRAAGAGPAVGFAWRLRQDPKDHSGQKIATPLMLINPEIYPVSQVERVVQSDLGTNATLTPISNDEFLPALALEQEQASRGIGHAVKSFLYRQRRISRDQG